MRRRLTLAIAAVLLASVAITACGGSSGSGIAAKSPGQIANAAFTAVESAKSVHMAGTILNHGTPLTLDLHLASGVGAKGDVTVNGLRLHIIDVGQSIYIKAGSDFWRHFGTPAVATLLQGRWLKAPANNPNFATLSSLTDVRQLFHALQAGHGPLTKGNVRTVGGRQAIGLTDRSKGGTLYVATTGKPYPLELDNRTAGSPGRIVFDQYDLPVSIGPPANAIDLSKLPAP